MKAKIVLALLLAVVVLVGCAKQPNADDGAVVRTIYASEHIATAGGYRIYRFVDREYGYICYVTQSSGVGLDCNKMGGTHE